MTTIAATDGGNYYHHETWHKQPFNQYIDQLIYLPELAETDLTPFDAVIVSCRSNPKFVTPLASKWLDYLNQGGTLVVFADSAVESWLPNIRFHQHEVNYWWWLEKNAKHDIQPKNQHHSLYQYLDHKAMTWHYHGTYTPPQDAEVLLQHPDGSAVLFDDRASYPGRLIVTSLDPEFHHGSHFMPSATAFLHGFLPWLREELKTTGYIDQP